MRVRSIRRRCSCHRSRSWAALTTGTFGPTVVDSCSTDYRVRIINEDVFGKDVAIPELKITYRVRTQVNGAAIEGMEKTYNLPALSMRVLSLVPAGATDIRDATASTFGDIEDRLFRANLLTTLGGVLFGLSAIFVLVALVRAVARYRARRPAAAGVVGDADILRGVRAELGRIGRAREGGWTPEVAGRLLTALRVLAAFALSKPASHSVAPAGREIQDGYLEVRGGWTRGKRVSVFGYITPLDVTREMASKANESNRVGGADCDARRVAGGTRQTDRRSVRPAGVAGCRAR